MKCFCFQVFVGCDDHTLNLKLVGRLEQGQCSAFVCVLQCGGGTQEGHSYTLYTGKKAYLVKSLGSQI